MPQDRKPGLLVLASTYPRWSGDPEPGFVHELARRMTGRFRVTVLCPHAPGVPVEETMDGVDVVRYRYAPEAWETLVNDGGVVANLRRAKWKCALVPGFVLAQAWCAWRLVRRRRINVVHAHWLVPQGLVAVLLSKLGRRGLPFLVTSHGADLFALRAWPFPAIKRLVIREAADVTVVSEGMLAEIAQLGGDRDRVGVEPMGVDLKGRFRPDPSVSRSRSEILFVGRLVEKKGLQHLLNAMPLIRSKRPDVRLTIAGFGPDMEARREQVARLGMEDSVEFLGPIAQIDLPGLYRRAALFVAPFVEARSGDQDGLGLVLIEALGCGCPVVASNLPATRALLVSCAAAYEAVPGDPTSISQAVLKALDAGGSPLGEDIAGFDWEVRAAAYGARLDYIAADS
ncbi:glycosyltransferase [Luteimonas sp. M1R5S18]|uniref:Glycosyltransferase n=1 Tax=Luteimonas rhizosphaericola TaxID=3042024 RepID=A0ABT6JKW5_9GAMM|nr:glycosyltransferase [Luteimonas rhizosphaericola]MDH5831318.1 glycosyltransferase [Luteimonas rhizosphaericola]